MFENLLFQNAGKLLADDICHNSVPGSILLSGPVFSGKLTCALEFSRVLSCTGIEKGSWSCVCPSCLKNKLLSSPDLILCGPRDCSLEISASKEAFLRSVEKHEAFANATRYLFIRSIKKLTLRFSQILWEDDEKVSKIAPLTSVIDELLEEIMPERQLTDYETLVNICTELVEKCNKLESQFMYDSIPVAQIRRISSWARLTTAFGKKIVIIENANQMQETSRNALLKILEEPPSDVVFILTTTQRGAVMPTILSRVRTYGFIERTQKEQQEVISRIFHQQNEVKSVADYLQTFLSVSPEKLFNLAEKFQNDVIKNEPCMADELVKEANGFEPRILFKLFLNSLIILWKNKLRQNNSSSVTEKQFCAISEIRNTLISVSTYNQSPSAALEMLAGKLRILLSNNFGE